MSSRSAELGRVVSQADREPLRLRLARLAARTIRTRTVQARPHPPLVSFTFDDIPATAAERGAAILEQSGARGTFYIAGGLVGTVEPGRRLVTAEQCGDLHRRGHEIGCHTFSHRAVSGLSRPALADDLARNAAFLAGVAPQIAPTNFAYPFNTTSLRAKRQLERHFASCRGGVPGINTGRIDLGFLRAVELADGYCDEAMMRGWIARTVATRGWLIFFSHGVSEYPEPYGCHPDLLRLAVAEARAEGATIVTMREALRQVIGGNAAGTA
ncbi:polysaccharide deacetylase family protein [Methylobacterium gnaphalii]|uniref:Chitooligosaccharide deacetylase n=1 Tax=Methylobacterium gnaphalii TaxID=1010610 RepID=A0A512JKM2_9HYPH|nr:polysaccharide deacetylase family protein [Methylobacterium gnaphalii]GEP10508.1 polysaccharide deacetylase [Methylobacterium gnaphalii]GJD69265.1 hypothetical protein MMMDOFMJ_2193 [Methylobacterium gnaphalii]GLS47928.1 polysaccharide deacetylase [Methylobacterium gnaphalii]